MWCFYPLPLLSQPERFFWPCIMVNLRLKCIIKWNSYNSQIVARPWIFAVKYWSGVSCCRGREASRGTARTMLSSSCSDMCIEPTDMGLFSQVFFVCFLIVCLLFVGGRGQLVYCKPPGTRKEVAWLHSTLTGCIYCWVQALCETPVLWKLP